jgi:hypothetical protein
VAHLAHDPDPKGALAQSGVRFSEKDHAQKDISADFAVLKRCRLR